MTLFLEWTRGSWREEQRRSPRASPRRPSKCSGTTLAGPALARPHKAGSLLCVLVNVSGMVPACCYRNFSLLSFGEEAEEDEEETMVVSKVGFGTSVLHTPLPSREQSGIHPIIYMYTQVQA